jgi:hypothetical protein
MDAYADVTIHGRLSVSHWGGQSGGALKAPGAADGDLLIMSDVAGHVAHWGRPNRAGSVLAHTKDGRFLHVTECIAPEYGSTHAEVIITPFGWASIPVGHQDGEPLYLDHGPHGVAAAAGATTVPAQVTLDPATGMAAAVAVFTVPPSGRVMLSMVAEMAGRNCMAGLQFDVYAGDRLHPAPTHVGDLRKEKGGADPRIITPSGAPATSYFSRLYVDGASLLRQTYSDCFLLSNNAHESRFTPGSKYTVAPVVTSGYVRRTTNPLLGGEFSLLNAVIEAVEV